MSDKVCGIYKITNTLNNKVYIGKSKDVRQRLSSHKSNLKKPYFNKRTNHHLWLSVKKYGLEHFTFELIERVEDVDGSVLSQREMYWINYYRSHIRLYGYNSMYESSGVFKHSQETRLKLSEATKRLMTEERRKQISEKLTGVKQDSEMVKRRIEKTVRARTGIKIAEDKKEAMRESHAVYSYEQYSLDGELLQVFKRRKDLIDAGFERATVQAACVGKLKTSQGFIWKRIPKVSK